MTSEFVRLTRQQLYDLVWSEPMRTLASRYAVSDVGLSKACRRMKVPVPGRGYWRRKETGHPVVRERLPALPTNASHDLREITLTVRAAKVLSTPDDASAPSEPLTVVDRQVAFECDATHQIKVAETLDAAEPLHPLVRKTQIAFQGARPIDRGLVRPFVRDGRVPWGPLDEMERLRRASKKRPEAALNIAVTPGQIERALRIMDALLKALEARGYPVFCTPRRGRPHPEARQGYPPPETVMTRVEVGDEDVFVVLREIVSKAERAPETPVLPNGRRRAGGGSLVPAPPSKHYENVGSSRFAVIMPNFVSGFGVSFPAWRWEESAKRYRLEDALGEVVVGVVTAAEEFKAWRERRAAAERDAAERARLHAEAERRRAAEAAREQELERQLGARRTAAEAREYAAELRAAAGDALSETLASWVSWIEAYANRVDPVLRLTSDDASREAHARSET